MLKKPLALTVIILFISVSVIPSTGTVVEKKIQATFSEYYEIDAIDDSHIFEFFPDENYGDGVDISIGPDQVNFSTNERWGYIRFDTSIIPLGSHIIYAYIALWYYGKCGEPVGRIIDCYRVRESWSENTITWSNKPSHHSIKTSSTIVPPELSTIMIWDVKNDVQGYIDGTFSNYGWLLKDTNADPPSGGSIVGIGLESKDSNIPSFSPVLLVVVNNPPSKPQITGLTEGKPGESYNYTFVTTDPDGDDVCYFIEWGDDKFEEWGPYESGEEVIRSHTWGKKGEYTIRAKGKDIYGAESDWGTLDVTMPVNQHSLFLWFLERFPNAFPILRNLLRVDIK